MCSSDLGYSALGTRGQSPWRSRSTKETEAVSLPQPQQGTGDGTLAWRDAYGWCARAIARQRPSGKERRKSASGSVKKRRTLKERSGKECDLQKSRTFFALMIVTGTDKTTGLVRAADRAGRRRQRPNLLNILFVGETPQRAVPSS